jgi:hypothetical protein
LLDHGYGWLIVPEKLILPTLDLLLKDPLKIL